MANPSIQLGTNSNWAVKEDKLLAYKEYNDYFFNKEFDFSRGTSATYVAKDGLIKTAGIQPNIVNNGDFSELGSELVTNGDFATDSDWTLDTGWTIANGKASQDGTGTGNNGDIVQNSILDTGKTYKIVLDVVDYTQGTLYIDTSNIDLNVNGVGTYTLYFTPSSTNLFIRTRFSGFIGSIDNVSVKEVGQNWTVANDDTNNYVEFNQDEGTVRLKFLNTSPLTTLSSDTQYLSGKIYKLTVDVKEVVSGSVKIDAAGVSELFNSVGVQQRIIEPTGNANISFYRATANVDVTLNSVSLQEIQTDTPRIDFTNDTKGHLLLEPSRTNVITYSNGFDDLSWQKTAVNVTANAGISPDGTNNAYLIEAQSNISNHRTRKTGGPNNTVSVSIFAKKGTTDYAYFFCGGGSKHFAAIFDLSDGSVTDTNTQASGTILTSASSISLGNGWYRLQVSGSFTTPPGNRIGIVPYYQSTIVGTPDTSWLGSGESIYVYGAMEENYSYPTSYIPTTVATSTRNADVCNNSGTAQDFNSEEGVLYAEIAALADDGTFREMGLSDNTVTTRLIFSYTSTSNRVRGNVKIASSSTNFSLYYDATDVTDFIKVAVKFKSGDYALWVNGVERATNSTSNVFAINELTHLNFTSGAGSSSSMFGKARNVQVFTEALTDSELQELTS